MESEDCFLQFAGDVAFVVHRRPLGAPVYHYWNRGAGHDGGGTDHPGDQEGHGGWCCWCCGVNEKLLEGFWGCAGRGDGCGERLERERDFAVEVGEFIVVCICVSSSSRVVRHVCGGLALDATNLLQRFMTLVLPVYRNNSWCCMNEAMVGHEWEL